MNPFKKNGQILPIASINSVFIDDVLASDLFRLELIIKELKKNREILGFSSDISDIAMFNSLNDSLNSETLEIRNCANEIAVSFGKKLAALITTLKNPSLKAIENRPAWTKKHWAFWQGVKKLYFVGGLTSPILINIFYAEIMKALLKHNINDLDIRFIEGSLNLGTKGLVNLTSDGDHLLFDFGQTNIKRRFIIKQDQEIVIDSILPIIKAQFLDHKNKSVDELKALASKLDEFIIFTVIKTMNTVNYKGNNIIIAMANYLVDGKIYEQRGGYAKLALLKGNYEDHLANEITSLINRTVKVKLVHDTSAMALNFKKEKRTAVISLGTAFGIAFPD